MQKTKDKKTPAERLTFGEGRRGQSRRNRIGGLIEDWYGEEAPSAIAGHLPRPVTVAETIDKLTKKLIPEWMRGMNVIREHWTEIVGPAGAKRIEPVRLEDKVLWLELRHPMYRMAFDTPHMKTELLRKINEVACGEFCTEIRFTIAGMFARERKK